MKFVSPVISSLLATVLVAGPLPAQLPALPTAGSPLELRITHPGDVKPDDSVSVRVTDETGEGQADTTVVFRLTDSRFSGKFADGSRAATMRTDADGWARANGIHGFDPAAATTSVTVTASKGVAHAGTIVAQTFAPAAATVTTAAQANTSPVARPVVLPSTPLKAATPMPGAIAESRDMASTRNDVERATGVADESLDANVPPRHAFGPDGLTETAAGVSVVNGPNRSYSEHEGHSKTKWIVAIAAAAGAGVAVAMLHKGSGSTSSTASGVSIGAPSISVGHP